MPQTFPKFTKTDQRGQDRLDQQGSKEGPGIRGQKAGGPFGHGTWARCQPNSNNKGRGWRNLINKNNKTTNDILKGFSQICAA